MSDIWNFFDVKYVLSTPNSKRKNDLKENFKLAGLNDYEILDFTPSKQYINNGKNNNSGEGGEENLSLKMIQKHKICDDTCMNIANNMFTMTKKAYDLGANNMIIFEDDARFKIPINLRKLRRVVKWLATHEWDIFYLGYCQWPYPVSFFTTKDIVKLTSPLCLHSYCLSRSGMKKVIEESKFYNQFPQHIDKLYSKKSWKK